MASRAAPSWVRVKITDAISENLKTIEDKTGVTVNTQKIQAALKFAAANMPGTLPDGTARRK